MGLLDDAIKEHLELKRRHGADPGEVARLEHEALGPARREPVSAAPEAQEDLVDEPVAQEPVEESPAVESFYDQDDDDEVPADERLEAPVHHVEPEPEPAPEPEPEPREPEPELAAAPEPAHEPEPDLPSVEQPTRQFSLEELEAASQAPAEAEEAEDEEDDADEPPRRASEADVVPADDEPEGDDVLEETPEFLQETPEHDRLWFEQKPPRDFDF
jgi:hypothetical protein